MKTTCTVCGKTWRGHRPEHCTVCHETFNSTFAGDAHRRGEYPNRYCDTSKLIYDETKDVWITGRMPESLHRRAETA